MAEEMIWHRVYCAVCGGVGIQCSEPAGEPRVPDGRRESLCERCRKVSEGLAGLITSTGLMNARKYATVLPKHYNYR